MGTIVYSLYKQADKSGHPIVFKLISPYMLPCADVYIDDYYRRALEKGMISPEEAALRAYKIEFVE